MSDGNEFLMSGGAQGISFKTIGTTVRGRIVAEPSKRPVTDTKGNVRTFPNGETIYQVVVEMATDLRDPTRPDDDGIRSLWIKNKMIAAVREAVKRAGAPGLQVGGWLTVSFIGEEPPTVRGNDPTKLYAAEYTPAPSAGNDALMAGPGAAGGGTQNYPPPQTFATQPTYQQYQSTPPAAPPQPAATGAQWAQGGQAPWMQGGQPVAAQSFAPPVPVANGAPPPPPPPAPPGFDPNQWPAMWERMDDAQRAAVQAAMANVAPF